MCLTKAKAGEENCSELLGVTSSATLWSTKQGARLWAFGDHCQKHVPDERVLAESPAQMTVSCVCNVAYAWECVHKLDHFSVYPLDYSSGSQPMGRDPFGDPSTQVT